MPELKGVLNALPAGVPPLFESEDIATAALAAFLAETFYPDIPEAELSKVRRQRMNNMARTIVRNVASMVLEDWIE